jgi:hypothetical protein
LWDIADFVAGNTTEQKEIQKQRKKNEKGEKK